MITNIYLIEEWNQRKNAKKIIKKEKQRCLHPPALGACIFFSPYPLAGLLAFPPQVCAWTQQSLGGICGLAPTKIAECGRDALVCNVHAPAGPVTGGMLRAGSSRRAAGRRTVQPSFAARTWAVVMLTL